MILKGVKHVVNLLATSPANGLLPTSRSGVSLNELALGQLTSVAPFEGQIVAVEALLGMVLPKAGRSVGKLGAELVWFSQGQYLAIGFDVDDAVKSKAAITDQSDAWCALEIKGDKSEAVLARLVPVDLRAATFKRGHALRSQLGHMPLHITRTGKDVFRLLSFRSMAGTMVHEISRAMDLLDSRG